MHHNKVPTHVNCSVTIFQEHLLCVLSVDSSLTYFAAAPIKKYENSCEIYMASQLKENSVLHSPILLMLLVLLSSTRN